MNDIIISVRDLCKCFGDFVAVDHITFDVKRGEIFGFLGANGAGKTTAMRMLCGLSYPTSGRGMVAGYDVMTQGEEIKKHIGYMSQKFSLYDELDRSREYPSVCRNLWAEPLPNASPDGGDVESIAFPIGN